MAQTTHKCSIINMKMMYPTWYILSQKPKLDIYIRIVYLLYSKMAYFVHHMLPLKAIIFLGTSTPYLLVASFQLFLRVIPPPPWDVNLSIMERKKRKNMPVHGTGFIIDVEVMVKTSPLQVESWFMPNESLHINTWTLLLCSESITLN